MQEFSNAINRAIDYMPNVIDYISNVKLIRNQEDSLIWILNQRLGILAMPPPDGQNRRDSTRNG